MRLSTLLGRTRRDIPADAELPAHQLLLRAGMIRQLGAGGYALLPLGMAVVRQIERILYREMAAIGGQEFRTPVVQPASLWQQTGRYEAYGDLMLRATDRAERPLVVAPTHEEAVAELARREVTSYRHLPALIYQIHTKYRDEPRPRGGLLRLREFTMLDAYSLDADANGLAEQYARVGEAFVRMFAACGVAYTAVEASGGDMGGSETREYMVRSEHGEDTLAVCAACGYAANAEVARRQRDTPAPDAAAPQMTPIATPNAATIAELAALLGVPTAATAKAVFFEAGDGTLVFAVVRGDRDVSEAKLMAATQTSALRAASAERIRAAGAEPGYASPVGVPAAERLIVVADWTVVHAGPLVAGANRPGFHLRNVVYQRDWQATLVADIAEVAAGDGCPRCGEPLELTRGIEIGHIFQLGTRYTTALGATYLDAQGTPHPTVMGSYGIGLERLMQVIVEQHHDAAGIIWPDAIAPADVHLLSLGKGETAQVAAAALYQSLQQAGVRVLWDDRNESAGVKFNDADLIGVPVRVVVSERLLAGGEVEVKRRTGTAERIPQAGLLAYLRP